jgi:hypothetical protein
VVLSHNRPIFKIEPLTGKDLNLEKLAVDVGLARADVRKGRLLTAQQVRKNLGL